MKQNKKKHSWLNNIITIMLAALLVLMIVKPSVKSIFIRGMMKAGFFQPKIKDSNLANSFGEFDYQVNFTSLDGTIIPGDSLKGKVVFINLWATWCPPCVAELPAIHQLYSELKSHKIQFLLVNVENNLPKATAFLRAKNLEMPVVQMQGSLPKSWYSGTLPTTIVLDKKGNAVFRETGAADYANKNFKNFILHLMNQN